MKEPWHAFLLYNTNTGTGFASNGLLQASLVLPGKKTAVDHVFRGVPSGVSVLLLQSEVVAAHVRVLGVSRSNNTEVTEAT